MLQEAEILRFDIKNAQSLMTHRLKIQVALHISASHYPTSQHELPAPNF